MRSSSTRKGARHSKQEDGFWFDEAAADRAVYFFKTYLRHIKGRWAGHPFELEPWQEEIIREIFGWKRPDGTRRYRIVYIEVPRKNGKSTLSAGIALYLTFADEEQGAEVYSAAADREQAAIVFEAAKSMAEGSPALNKRCKTYRRSIVTHSGNSYKVLSADVPTKHGLNAHGVICDELHTQPNRHLWDVLLTSTGSREQPMVVAITTAGFDRNSICWEQHEYARKVLDGTIDDPSFFAYIAAADEKDDWRKKSTWKKANPGLGVTVSEDYLAQECRRAKHSPAYQNTFRRLHLNQWTQQAKRWLDLARWDACLAVQVGPEDLKGRLCYGGLDLASSVDIAAFVMVFPPTEDDPFYRVLPHFWVPAENMREREDRDRVPYSTWVRDGLVEATPGNVIDYAAILAKIEHLGELYQLEEIGFDRWGAVQLSQDLDAAGFTVVPIGQGFASMSPPTKELLKLVIAQQIRHDGNAVLRWMADNMVTKEDPAGNVKPDKAKSTQRIDGMVALIMALDRAIRHEETRSVYEDRGVRVLEA